MLQLQHLKLYVKKKRDKREEHWTLQKKVSEERQESNYIRVAPVALYMIVLQGCKALCVEVANTAATSKQ